MEDILIDILKWVLTLLVLFLITKYNWQRICLFYYSFNIPGPFALAIIGSIHFLFINRKDFFKGVVNMVESSPPVSKLWVGPNLYIFTSRPTDVDVILNKFLEKTSFYSIVNEFAQNSLLTAPVKIWRKNRKVCNHCFSPKVVKSYLDIFNRSMNDLIKCLEENNGKGEDNLCENLWEKFLNAEIEALGDLDPKHLEEGLPKKIMKMGIRLEELIVKRFHNIWLYNDFLWKLSSAGREAALILQKGNILVNKVLDASLLKEKQFPETDLRRYRLVNYLRDSKVLSRNQVLQEMKFFGVAGSETLACTLTSILLVIGIEQEVQEQIYQEQLSIFQNDDKSPINLEDIGKMEYLERVIKETMRIFPPVPFMIRSATENIFLDPYVFPAGSHLLIPIIKIHRSPDLWPDPLKFNPDRFLPEEVQKRHRCAYIPFSLGARDCIGLYYSMVFLKIAVAALVRAFKIRTVDCDSVKDIEMDFYIVAKPRNHKVIFERRK